MEIQERLGRILSKNAGKYRLFTAESCTGGLIASTLASVAGASEFLWGGAVVYSNEAKVQICGLDPEILEAHGAVSEECIEGLLWGAKMRFPVSLVLAVSGIAGPTGASREKPVGLVYLGILAQVGERRKVKIERHHFNGSRNKVQEAAMFCGLELIEFALDWAIQLEA